MEPDRIAELRAAALRISILRAEHPEEFGSFANDIHALDMLEVALEHDETAGCGT